MKIRKIPRHLAILVSSISRHLTGQQLTDIFVRCNDGIYPPSPDEIQLTAEAAQACWWVLEDAELLGYGQETVALDLAALGELRAKMDYVLRTLMSGEYSLLEQLDTIELLTKRMRQSLAEAKKLMAESDRFKTTD